MFNNSKYSIGRDRFGKSGLWARAPPRNIKCLIKRLPAM